MHYDGPFTDALLDLETNGLLRSLRTLPASGGVITWQGRRILNFSSNDYLDLANHPALKAGAVAAIEKYGCGSTASRLMAGHLELHERLEARLAAFTGMESALVFPTGYQTNVGVITALAGPGDAVFSDALNHASIVDGCRLSRAAIHVHRHNDMAQLEELLSSAGSAARRIVVSDSIFSMDGDAAPLRELERLARKFDALLVLDEAHAIGIHGDGAGLARALGVRPDVIVGTLSKALGGEGGFAAGSARFRSLLINGARSFIFSTGLAPACAGSALAAIDTIAEAPGLGTELLRRAAFFRGKLRENGIDTPDDPSPIVPVILCENRAAMACSAALLDEGILVAAVRPPSVPEGTARLRFSLTLAHGMDDLEWAAGKAGAALVSSGK